MCPVKGDATWLGIFLRVGFLQVPACSRMLEGRQGRMDLVRRRCHRDEQSTEEEEVEEIPLECVGSFTLGSWKAREGLPFARNFPCTREPVEPVSPIDTINKYICVPQTFGKPLNVWDRLYCSHAAILSVALGAGTSGSV